VSPATRSPADEVNATYLPLAETAGLALEPGSPRSTCAEASAAGASEIAAVPAAMIRRRLIVPSPYALAAARDLRRLPAVTFLLVVILP
jgi:hypothetical protein